MLLRKKSKIVLTYQIDKPWKWVSDKGVNGKVVYINA
jgi:hypothetical protein|tara:strand:- start:1189 stop:1299 length:111 start_codon:yes stop_codon:yes gene_type:complete